MVKELNIAATTTKNQDWWLDSGTIIHVSHDKNTFKTYSEVKESEKVLMCNHVTAEVAGKGIVEINFTSGQKLTLLNAFHLSKILKNLISTSLLSKRGFKIVVETDHVILSKSGIFVEKRL
ncbi:uncharacterized protein [Nicotiana sylvestris]|uniref:uncharacterized protein n=1 Tax=Nicotiana sylvestris TaxID=4096 RepID=UPI00388C67ED